MEIHHHIKGSQFYFKNTTSVLMWRSNCCQLFCSSQVWSDNTVFPYPMSSFSCSRLLCAKRKYFCWFPSLLPRTPFSQISHVHSQLLPLLRTSYRVLLPRCRSLSASTQGLIFRRGRRFAVVWKPLVNRQRLFFVSRKRNMWGCVCGGGGGAVLQVLCGKKKKFRSGGFIWDFKGLFNGN